MSFRSSASELVPGDTNASDDVFVRDRTAGTTERVSVSSGGSQGTGLLYFSSISADGRYVAFVSEAPELVLVDTNSDFDVFVHDRATGTTERVSVASGGSEAEGLSTAPSISADGRYVAFQSYAPDLVPGDTNKVSDVFVRDRGGALGVVGTLWSAQVSEGMELSGRATFPGKLLVGASDPGNDSAPVPARSVGAELTGAKVVYRPEEKDIHIVLDVEALPPLAGGFPGIIYGLELERGGLRYEVRAMRARATSDPPQVPHIALYACPTVCIQLRTLQGGIGTTGHRVTVSVPVAALEVGVGTTEATPLEAIRAFTAVGESAPARELDELELPDATLPASRVELGIAPRTTPESGVDFSTPADLLNADFSGTVPTSGLPSGDYRVWARACFGDTCEGAVHGNVRL